MLPPLFQVLKASSRVGDIAGTRIWRHGTVPDNVDKPLDVPFVTWFLVASSPENHLSGTPSTDRMVLQVDCWHPDGKGVEALAKAVRDAIEPYSHLTGQPFDGRDEATKLYRMALQFDWFNDRDA